MVWVGVSLLALLVLPTLGALGSAGVVRWRFARAPEVFPCRIRVLRGVVPGARARWSWTRCHAIWRREVLLVETGRLVPRTLALPVATAVGSVEEYPTGDVRRLGPHPVDLCLRLDDGAEIDVATRSVDAHALAGPFVVAQLPRGASGAALRRYR